MSHVGVQGNAESVDLATELSSTSSIRRVVLVLRQKPLMTLGLLLILAVVVFCMVGPILSPYTSLESDQDQVLSKPSSEHWLGTDQYGRDIATRIAAGGRTSLAVAAGAVFLSMMLGTVIAMFSGYYGGKLDYVLQRFVEVEMSIPTLLLLLIVAGIAGQSVLMLIFTIGTLTGIRASRVIRTAVMTVRSMAFVEAAVATGCSGDRVVVRHILPNVFAPILVLASIGLGQAIIIESTLSFLGYGVSPPNPSWGGMLGGSSRPFMYEGPWLPLVPGAFLAATVYGFNMVGDGLRDVLDPRLRGA